MIKKNRIHRAFCVGLFAIYFILMPFTDVFAMQLESEYVLAPEDVLEISVWKDKDLTKKVGVRPDGKISFPLIGDVEVAGHTIEWVKRQIMGRIKEYVPDAVVSVMLLDVKGMFVSVVGKVKNPGAEYSKRRLNVMQAIAITGGLTKFAKESDILILRTVNGEQTQIKFDYKQVKKGKNIHQNILLADGDVIVVP